MSAAIIRSMRFWTALASVLAVALVVALIAGLVGGLIGALLAAAYNRSPRHAAVVVELPDETDEPS